MVMAVVEVGHVRVRVGHRRVTVAVSVPPVGADPVVAVFVVSVVVLVLVFVLDADVFV